MFTNLNLMFVFFPKTLLMTVLILCLSLLTDLSHVFSSVNRDLNFIDHTGDLGWKEYENHC